MTGGAGGGPANGESRPEGGREGGGFREHLQTFVVAVLIALAIRAFVIEPFRIPSGSMMPTLLVGDHLFVNKFLFGPKLPGIAGRLPGLREPRRGDVVVFTVARRDTQILPADRGEGLRREEFVKRIVGLPGDRIELRSGQLYVNGEEVPARPTEEVFDDDLGRRLDVHEERLGGCVHRVLDDPDLRRGDSSDFTVEEGRYFVLGDNRDYSNDSRGWGTVRLEEIKGPAFVLYWSWDWNGAWRELLSPRTWWELLGERMRWRRIGDGVGCDAAGEGPGAP